VAGTSNRNKLGMDREVEKISKRLARVDESSVADAPDVSGSKKER